MAEFVKRQVLKQSDCADFPWSDSGSISNTVMAHNLYQGICKPYASAGKRPKGLVMKTSNFCDSLKEMVRPERFELPTTWFVARYSIQLSYGRIVQGLYSTAEREKTH